MRNTIPLAQRRKARQLIMQALYQWLMTKDDPLDIEKQYHEDNSGKIDWDYFDAIFKEIPKQQDSLDQHISPLLDRAKGSLDPVERACLYLGTFELANRIDVPYRVVINECVELAKQYGATDGHKYVNGILDKLVPELRPIEYKNKP
jgi:N utilization substance protein B